MIISFYFHCSHSLKQKVDSLFTTSKFPMSTDVSYNSVVKDTAPLLQCLALAALLCLALPGSADRGTTASHSSNHPVFSTVQHNWALDTI